ncbi:hypothetical protein, partial [Mycobacterium sp.]|uniref:hypothetical protein n=1 Tax=Mycobacterium sp. TaxID=1785 RepID=UPI002CDD5B6A
MTIGTSGLSSARRYAQPSAKPPPPTVLRRSDHTELSVAAASKRAFKVALATPCPTHAALVGEPCWSVMGEFPG